MSTLAAEIARLLPKMTVGERQQLEQTLQAPKPLWQPDPQNKPQTLAYHSLADVVGFGGAAGGGKTELAIGKSLTQHQRTLILRRVSPELMQIVDRLCTLLGGREAYNGKDQVFRLEARQIELGSVPNVGDPATGFADETKYQGRDHDLLVFDEATNFPQATVTFLSGWVRSSDPDQHCQMLLTFNPPMTAEGRWVIEFFGPWLDPTHPDPAVPGELRWYYRDPYLDKDVACLDGTPRLFPEHPNAMLRVVKPKSRTFIPSRVTDNSYYRDSGYIATLQALPEPLRSRLMNGDFLAGIEADPMQVIPTEWIEIAMSRWRLPDRKPPMETMGVDVARGGVDFTAFARRHVGLWFDRPIKVSGRETPTGQSVANLVAVHLRDQAPINLDVIGVGASPYDILRDSRFQVQGINAAEAAPGSDRTGRLQFFNLRAWMWWHMRDLLDPEANTGICLPNDPELLKDLSAPRWMMRGKAIIVEAREEIIKRIGRSPDLGTAYVMAGIDTPKIGDIDRSGSNVRRLAYEPHEAYAQAQVAQSRVDYNPHDRI